MAKEKSPGWYRWTVRGVATILAGIIGYMSYDTYKQAEAEKPGTTYGLIVDDDGAVTGLYRSEHSITFDEPDHPGLQKTDKVIRTEYRTGTGEVCIKRYSEDYFAPLPGMLESKEYPWDGICSPMTATEVASAKYIIGKLSPEDRTNADKNLLWRVGLKDLAP